MGNMAMTELQQWADSEAHAPSARVGLLADLEGNPEPGRTYLVPAVYGSWHPKRHMRMDDECWWPVIGALHNDKRFFHFSPQHYHIDLRFLGRGFIAGHGYGTRGGILDPNIFTRFEIAAFNLSASPLQTSALRNRNGLHRPVLRRFRCHTPFIDMALFRDVSFKNQNLHGVPGMVAALPAAKRGKDGHFVCPHQKFSLKQVSPDEDGNLVCPMHGLKICSKTGALS